jgi:hypothetical protein
MLKLYIHLGIKYQLYLLTNHSISNSIYKTPLLVAIPLMNYILLQILPPQRAECHLVIAFYCACQEVVLKLVSYCYSLLYKANFDEQFEQCYIMYTKLILLDCIQKRHLSIFIKDSSTCLLVLILGQWIFLGSRVRLINENGCSNLVRVISPLVVWAWAENTYRHVPSPPPSRHTARASRVSGIGRAKEASMQTWNIFVSNTSGTTWFWDRSSP